jgi:putative membrane protein
VTPPAGTTPSASPPAETQPERTALAWQRTGLGVLAVAGLLGHRAVEEERRVLLVLAGAAALLGLVVLGALAPVRYRDVRRRVGAGAGAAAPRLVIAVTATVLLVAAAAAVAVLTPR